MKRSALIFILAAQLLAHASFAAPIPYNQLPEGLQSARPLSQVGVLGSAHSDPMSVYYQQLLDQSESKAYGLAYLSANQTPLVQAEASYYVESVILGLIHQLINDTTIQNQSEREMLIYRAISIYRTARFSGERVFEVMIREIDAAKPGTSGIQLPTDTDDGVVYSPNYRLERPLSTSESQALYAQKLFEFTASGGSFDDIKILSPATIEPLPDVAMVEFVEMPSGEIRFTPGSAGHIIMARGQDVASAGTMLLMKDTQGQVRFAAVSNSSGSYKPDLMQVADFSGTLSTLLNIPGDNIVLTKGEPTSTQTMKILMKAADVSPDVIKAEIAAAKSFGATAQSAPTSIVSDTEARARACRAIFN